MVSSSFAPLLSATLSRLSCWITGPFLERQRSSGFLHHLDHAPALVLGDRPGLHDAHQIADPALVGLVVRLEVLAALHDLLVERVTATVGHLDHHRLVHLVRDHAPGAYLAVSPPRALLHVRHASSSSLDALRPRRGVEVGPASGAGSSSVVISPATGSAAARSAPAAVSTASVAASVSSPARVSAGAAAAAASSPASDPD